MTPDRIKDRVDELCLTMTRWAAWRQAEQEFGSRKTYHAYLKSEEWRQKRDLVIARSAKRCECCGQRDAWQVHHLSYRYKYFEPLWDLRAVCDPCHEAMTAIDNGVAPKVDTHAVQQKHDGRPDFLRHCGLEQRDDL